MITEDCIHSRQEELDVILAPVKRYAKVGRIYILSKTTGELLTFPMSFINAQLKVFV